MKFLYYILTLLILFSCKNENKEASNRFNAINDKDYLDSIKAEYKNYHINPDDKNYKYYIGLNDFCYDNTRLKVHKILFSDNKDERITGEFPAYKSLEKVNDSILNTFSIKEKLVFALVYPEKHSQTCSHYYELDEELNKLIIPKLPRGEEGFYASERQLNALKSNPDSVSFYIKDCFRNKDIPLEIYNFITKLKLFNSIPFLLEKNSQKDNSFILAVFINLMMSDNYEPFLKSKLFKEMSKDSGENPTLYNLRSAIKTEYFLNELIEITSQYYKWKLKE